MLLENKQPFIDTRAFDKSTSTYVSFPTQSDAMLASLQLFHDVPCRIMNLIISVVTQPSFDAKQLTLSDSVDIINFAEEARLKDRMAAMYKRSLNNTGVMQQAGLPQFVLEEVLDIIEADRVARIKARFEKKMGAEDMFRSSRRLRIKENPFLSNMSLVHRSWTLSAQKALGRSLYIGRRLEKMDFLLQSPDKSIFGPWTSLIAVDLYSPVKTVLDDNNEPYRFYYDGHVEEKYHHWFEYLHRLLVSFKNLKCILLRSYTDFFTEWSNLTIRDLVWQNRRLEALTLYAVRGSFDLVPLLENNNALVNLRSLSIQDSSFSGEYREYLDEERLERRPIENNLAILSCLSTRCAHLAYLTIKMDLDFDAWPAILDAIQMHHAIRGLTFQFTDILAKASYPGWREWTEDLSQLPKSKRFPVLESFSLGIAYYFLLDIGEFHSKMKSECNEAGIRYT